MDKPYYPHKPIATVDSLARTLGIVPKLLITISNRVDDSYNEYDLKDKNRIVFDPKFELKKIQKRINHRIFEKVEFPDYLQGGIKAEDKRDYIENAKKHSHAETLINLDIKKFYTNIKEDQVKKIFKHFFNFPDPVVDILTKLTTYRGMVPQGACTSSYLANLVLFDSEYKEVLFFKRKNITYSRLLDDVTLSSLENLDKKVCEKYIIRISNMFKAYRLKLNNSKTKIEYRNTLDSQFTVTGVWVGHKEPKLRKKERRYIRQLVYICEQQFEQSSTSLEYHAMWNKTSGKVAKLTRLEHHQANDLRLRLGNILPTFDEYTVSKINRLTDRLLKIPKEHTSKVGRVKEFHKLMYKMTVLSRTHKGLAKQLSAKLKIHFANAPKKKDYWLG